MNTEEMIELREEEVIEDPLKIEPISNIKSEFENTDPLFLEVEPSSSIKLEPENSDNLIPKVSVSENGFKDKLKNCEKKSRLKRIQQRRENHKCDKCDKTFNTEKLLKK